MKIIGLALRAVLHFRSYTIINILGLALSLACVIILFRYVNSEFNVDRFHEKSDRIYVTTLDGYSPSGKTLFQGAFNPGKETSYRDITKASGIEKSTQFSLYENEKIISGKKEFEITALVSDSNFLDIMTYPVAEGLSNIKRPDEIIVTSSLAQKLFGKESAVGKSIHYEKENKELKVVGVMKEPQTKSSLDFDLIMFNQSESLILLNPVGLVLLFPNVDYQKINEEYKDFFHMEYWNMDLRFQLYPLSEVYLSKGIVSTVFKTADYKYILILTGVGFLLLIVGAVNFINIYSVILSRRGRELGMKKVFGADGFSIFIQLTVECMAMIGVALIIALALTETAGLYISKALGVDQVSDLKFDVALLLSFLFLIPATAAFSQFIRYHYSTPIKSLQSVGNTGGRGFSRKAFLLLQYAITIFMIIISAFFMKQLHYMLNADLGYKTKDIIKVPFQYKDREVIKQQMSASPLFSGWTCGQSPNYIYPGTENQMKFSSGDSGMKKVTLLGTSNEWMDLFDIKLIEGRRWDDSKELSESNLIISKSACKYFGIKDINDAKLEGEHPIWLRLDNPNYSNLSYKVVGVVNDFYVSHLGREQYPVVMYYSAGFYQGIMKDDLIVIASILPGHKQEALKFLKKLHDETVGDGFKYTFVEDEVHDMYKEDKKVSTIYTIFTVIAILVSSLGLFSISLFDVQQRYKEIAIRKVNGATFPVIVRILVKKYLILLCLAFVIAAPLAWLGIHSYLKDFAYKTPMSWWLFVLAFIVTAAISLLTLLFQVRKAANVNPAEILKSE